MFEQHIKKNYFRHLKFTFPTYPILEHLQIITANGLITQDLTIETAKNRISWLNLVTCDKGIFTMLLIIHELLKFGEKINL